MRLFDCPEPDQRADEELKAAAREVLEGLECLLYLMEREAADPNLIRSYVREAKKVLIELRGHVDENQTTPSFPYVTSLRAAQNTRATSQSKARTGLRIL